MSVLLYSTGCPKCSVLEKKLKGADIKFSIINDMSLMLQKGFKSAPMLEVDGEVMDFKKAINWIKNKQE